MLLSFAYFASGAILRLLVGRCRRSELDNDIELIVLRPQLAVLRRRGERPKFISALSRLPSPTPGSPSSSASPTAGCCSSFVPLRKGASPSPRGAMMQCCPARAVFGRLSF